MALRETPDLKVGGSTPFGLKLFYFGHEREKNSRIPFQFLPKLKSLSSSFVPDSLLNGIKTALFIKHLILIITIFQINFYFVDIHILKFNFRLE